MSKFEELVRHPLVDRVHSWDGGGVIRLDVHISGFVQGFFLDPGETLDEGCAMILKWVEGDLLAWLEARQQDQYQELEEVLAARKGEG